MRKRGQSFRVFVTSGLLASFFLALVLAVAPQLHERFHKDAAASQHQCAVTLIASGKYEQSDAAPTFVVVQLADQFAQIPALHPTWVAAPFLSASIFEHAPPALS